MGLGRGGNCRIYPIAFTATHAQLILWNKMGGRWETRQRRGDDLWFTLRRRSHHDVAGEDVQGEEGGRSQLNLASLRPKGCGVRAERTEGSEDR